MDTFIFDYFFSFSRCKIDDCNKAFSVSHHLRSHVKSHTSNNNKKNLIIELN